MNVWGWLWDIALALLVGLALVWVMLIGVLVALRPRGALLTEAMRLLPDLLRLVARLARDDSLPRGVRLRLGLLLAYLAVPFDVIPDFIPVLGYADDAILVAATLRFVVRRADPDVVGRHWPGSPTGLQALRRLCGLPEKST